MLTLLAWEGLIIKLGEFKIKKKLKKLCQMNQEILKASKKVQLLETSPTNRNIVSKDLLRVFCKLFYLQLCVSKN